MTHSYVWHDSSICFTSLIHMFYMSLSHVWHDSFICVTWLIHMCDMTHSYVWHDSFVCVTWLIHMCDMTRPYVLQVSFICFTWAIHMCDVTRPCVWHDACIFVHEHTEWWRPIGCLIFTGLLSQKSPIISGSFAKRDLQLRASYAYSLP